MEWCWWHGIIRIQTGVSNGEQSCRQIAFGHVMGLPPLIQGICLDCNNILFGMFAMCKLMISEPLVYRLYVWCAIRFYLACLTCVNRWFPNHWYIGYIFGVKSHFIWHVWDVQTDYFWPRAESYTPPHILIKSWYPWWTPDKIQIDSTTSMWTPSGFCRD